MTTPLNIYIIAGETSGDTLGAHLMQSLRMQTNSDDLCFHGIGGTLMQEQGLKSLFPMSDLSVMGVAEIIPRLPKILRRIRQTSKDIIRVKPDIVITIDSPDFCFRVARKLQKECGDYMPQLVHYVAPTVWAWRPERAQKLASLYNGIICLYPIEPPYFEKEGMKTVFTGHPAVEAARENSGGGKGLRAEYGITQKEKTLGLLFGSRLGELQRIGPLLRQAAFEYIRQQDDEVQIIAPTLPHLRNEVRNLLESMPCKTHIIDDKTRKWDCFDAMDKALATSGTIGLELSIAGVPHIIGYKVNLLTSVIIRSKLTTKYAHLTNILHQKMVVPEFIQERCTAANMRDGLLSLSVDAEKQKRAFASLRDRLGGQDRKSPSDHAARFVLSCLKDNAEKNKKKQP